MDIEKRVEALERANRRYRIVLGCALFAVCGMAILGFGKNQVPDKIQAKAFEVVGDEGKILARVSTLDGQGAITTYNPKGEILVDLVPTQSGAGGIVVYDGTGKQTIVLTDVSGGGGSLLINNNKGQKVLSLGRNTNQGGSVTTYNQNNKRILLLTGDTAEAGVLLTYDNDDKQTGRLPGG